MDLSTRRIYELAKAEEQLDSLLRVEQKLIERRGFGYRHPFYEKKIEVLNGKICRLRMKLEG